MTGIIPETTSQQMKEADRIMSEEFNISALQMMENAGRLLANLAGEIFRPQSAVVLAGPGSNGADGLVAARYLHNKKVNVEVVLSTDEGELSEISAGHLDTLKRLGIPIRQSIGRRPDLFIDCLLGYGAKGAPYGRVAEIIKEAVVLGSPVLSCDAPSGFDHASGGWHEPAFRNSVCLALGLPKKGTARNQGIKALYAGDIGIPSEAYRKIGIEMPNIFADKDCIRIHDSSDEEQEAKASEAEDMLLKEAGEPSLDEPVQEKKPEDIVQQEELPVQLQDYDAEKRWDA